MGSNIFRNSYLAADLTFQDDKITWHCPEVDETREVMMEWETPIMNKMAEVAVSAGDHVLECGLVWVYYLMLFKQEIPPHIL